ncbi:MAG: Maf family protein [Rhodothermales bacterium]|nr:Maf family protein [Rhodothermales bacterium]
MHLRIPLILASASPRRRHLLQRLGLRFEVIPSHAEEHAPDGLPPEALVQQLAMDKAGVVAASHPDALTLGADTIVVLEGDVLGKPAGPAEARAMLRRLSGRTHTVFTGLALLYPANDLRRTLFEATEVTFGVLSDQEIDAYVATGAPLDKAGAYGIQEDYGALFVERIEGDFYTVMGLPLHRLYRLLQAEFPDLIAL